MNAMEAYGYARVRNDDETIESVAKSLNSKWLDVIIYHLPSEKMFLEKEIKEMVRKKINRGRVELYFSIKSPPYLKAHIDEILLKDYLGQIKQVQKKYPALGRKKNGFTMSEAFTLPGVVSFKSELRISDRILLQAANESISNLVKFRMKKGETIRRKLLQYVKRLETIVAKMEKYKPSPRTPELGKEEIAEELSLISFYLQKLAKEMREKSIEPKGKTIDFLTQGILRELNTAASKTKKVRITSFIVEAKNYSERIREQAQNIE
ncbi:MAG: DUF1732 domain-containing protein [Candidatus Omnitrophica bacterium]|nr:DUF1732 domain-containing protein [Candidatus Omnitrophota bacterium]